MKHAPPSADKPWATKESAALAEQLQRRTGAELPSPDPAKVYALPDLVDLAERRNRTTRAAWEAARGAAAGAGLSAAEFYPMLAVMASYGGGIWDLDLNFNNNITGLEKQSGLLGALFAGVLPSEISLDEKASGTYRALNAGAALRWMLFDFGTRHARHEAAKKLLTAANLAFNAAHQTVAFRVTEAYYAVESARCQVEASQVAASSAADVLAAAEARFNRGLLTEPPLLQARQAKAQADYGLESARAASGLAWVDLAEAVGLPPGQHLRLAAADFGRLRSGLQEPLDNYVKAALRQRPDLLAKVAVVQAREAELRASRADRLPKLALTGVADYNRFDTSVRNTGPLDAFGFGLQNYSGFLTVQWPAFTGFADDNKNRAAASAKSAAEEELALMKERTIAEVWRAYTRAKNALAQHEAAEALQKASHATYQSLLAGFEQGINPIQEVLAARAADAQARALAAESDHAIAASLATLAFGSGTIR
jgi:outer membrane protein TolC